MLNNSVKNMQTLLFCALMLFTLNGLADDSGNQDLLNKLTEIKNTLDSNGQEIHGQSAAVRSMNSTLQRGLTGNSGIAAFNNTATERNFRDWTPSSADLVKMVQQGLQTGSLTDQIKYYNEKFPVPTSENLDPNNPNSATANYGVFSAISTNAALGIADKSFDNAPDIIKQINFLYQQIDEEQTLKQGMDLNSVILLKIATLQTDLVRLQAQQLKMLGVSQEEGNIKRMFAAQFIQDVGK